MRTGERQGENSTLPRVRGRQRKRRSWGVPVVTCPGLLCPVPRGVRKVWAGRCRGRGAHACPDVGWQSHKGAPTHRRISVWGSILLCPAPEWERIEPHTRHRQNPKPKLPPHRQHPQGCPHPSSCPSPAPSGSWILGLQVQFLLGRETYSSSLGAELEGTGASG